VRRCRPLAYDSTEGCLVDRFEDLEARLAQVPLFATLPKEQRLVIAQLATHHEAPAGEELTREGEEGREFIILLDGEVEVSRGGQVITTLGPGSHFGEIALLAHAPRTATITAKTPVVAESIGRSGFALALAEVPGLSDELLAAMASRLAQLDASTTP
jgi:CRP-like cAMP-binding protein